eukprot:5265-Heterococcus_DN1.PRE.10
MFERPQDIVKQFNVSHTTLRRWADDGKIKSIRTAGGHFRYDSSSLGQQEEEKDAKFKFVYCRVSSPKQKEDLKRQEDSFKSSRPDHTIIKDIGSGLNYKRKGFLFLVDKILSGSVEEVVVAHRDGLCRFSFELFEWICKRADTKLVVIDQEIHSTERELSEDLMAIVHVFSCRHHGMRRYTKKHSSSPENKTATNSSSSKSPEKVDEMCETDVQQSTSLGKRKKTKANKTSQEAGCHVSAN